jgi:hypothetical protein
MHRRMPGYTKTVTDNNYKNSKTQENATEKYALSVW